MDVNNFTSNPQTNPESEIEINIPKIMEISHDVADTFIRIKQEASEHSTEDTCALNDIKQEELVIKNENGQTEIKPALQALCELEDPFKTSDCDFKPFVTFSAKRCNSNHTEGSLARASGTVGKKKYKLCFVPNCASTSKKAPNKIFITVPKSIERKYLWFKAVGREFPASQAVVHCCQDHFNLEEDVENYVKFKLMGGRIYMKQHVVPHIFDCLGEGNLAEPVEFVAVKQEQQQPYSCYICGFKSKAKHSLIAHFKTHTLFKCGFCNFETASKSWLTKHVKTHSKDGTISRKGELKHHLGRPLYNCTVCDYKCFKKGYLARHRKVHVYKEPLSCHYCDYKCMRKYMLKTHLRLHTGEKPYTCMLCTYRSHSRASLNLHQKTHSDCTKKNLFKSISLTSSVHKCVGSCKMCNTLGKAKNKLCFVPHCASSSKTTPNKIFVTVPKPRERKALWFKAVGRELPTSQSVFHCCQDHFNLEEDIENYVRYKLMGGRIFMKEHVIPHILDCQQGRKPVLTAEPVEFVAVNQEEQQLDSSSTNLSFFCSYCDYKATNRDELNSHTKIHLEEQTLFNCTLCGFKSAKKRYLKQHLKVHSDNKPFSCRFCDYKCMRMYMLRTHLRLHTGKKPYTCSQCNYRSRTKSSLKWHRKKHIATKPYKSKKKLFNSQSNESPTKNHSHISHHHSICNFIKKSELNAPKEVRPLYACTLCDFKSAQKKYLGRHYKVHKKPYRCQYCDYKCSRNSRLSMHLKLHTNEELYACAICGYKSPIKEYLRMHQKTHANSKLYGCSLCDYKFSTKWWLKVHLKNHGKDKRSKKSSARVEERTRKSCFVPSCSSTSKASPEKIFITVPKNMERRTLWFKAVGREDPMSQSAVYCCEDHFKLEEDIEHYVSYKMLGGRIYVKEHVVPHIFDRHKDKKQLTAEPLQFVAVKQEQ